MNAKKSYRKFQGHQDKIKDLKKTNTRFERVYNEYEVMSDELWKLENSVGESIPDDFLHSIQLQKSYLEDEIEDWLYNSDGENVE